MGWWVVLCSLLLLCTGCWNRIEVNDLAIATEVGMDRLDNGQLLLSVNLVVPGQVGTPGGAGGKGQEGLAVQTFSETGTDVMEAISRLQMKVPRKLFWGHMRVLIMGEQFARNGVRHGIDFWTRYRQPRMTIQMVVVPGEARSFLKAHPKLRRLPSEALREVIEATTGLNITIKDFLDALVSEGQDPVAPRFESVPADLSDPQQQEIQMTGVALFRDDRLIGWLNMGEMRGLIWLHGKQRLGTFTIRTGDDQEISLELIRSGVQFQVRTDHGRIVVDMSFRIETDVGENNSQLDVSQVQVLTRVQRLLVEQFKQRIRSTFLQLTREYHVDTIGIGREVMRTDPRAWAQLRKDWRTHLEQVQLELRVEAQIRRTGKHAPPLSLPEEELDKS